MFNQITDTILMIEPVAFGYNTETAVNNYFMQNDNMPAEQIQEQAHVEFTRMVEALRSKGIKVIVVKDTIDPLTPDSIFPNNWISFQKDNRVAMYPMFAVNRRNERRMDVVQRVIGEGFDISQMVDYSVYEKENRFLEGTGSMIFDRVNRIAYAALSARTDKGLFNWFCNDFGYEPVHFVANQTVENKRLPIYHTNVMLSVAENHVVVCLDCIDNPLEKEKLLQHFELTGKTIIEISEQQMQNYAGNVLQVRNQQNEKFTVISKTAFDSLEKHQIDLLESFNELLVFDVQTIEKYGGGSVRCMMAEVF